MSTDSEGDAGYTQKTWSLSSTAFVKLSVVLLYLGYSFV